MDDHDRNTPLGCRHFPLPLCRIKPLSSMTKWILAAQQSECNTARVPSGGVSRPPKGWTHIPAICWRQPLYPKRTSFRLDSSKGCPEVLLFLKVWFNPAYLLTSVSWNFVYSIVKITRFYNCFFFIHEVRKAMWECFSQLCCTGAGISRSVFQEIPCSLCMYARIHISVYSMQSPDFS